MTSGSISSSSHGNSNTSRMTRLIVGQKTGCTARRRILRGRLACIKQDGLSPLSRVPPASQHHRRHAQRHHHHHHRHRHHHHNRHRSPRHYHHTPGPGNCRHSEYCSSDPAVGPVMPRCTPVVKKGGWGAGSKCGKSRCGCMLYKGGKPQGMRSSRRGRAQSPRTALCMVCACVYECACVHVFACIWCLCMREGDHRLCVCP